MLFSNLPLPYRCAGKSQYIFPWINLCLPKYYFNRSLKDKHFYYGIDDTDNNITNTNISKMKFVLIYSVHTYLPSDLVNICM